jgi:hypothetical protein
MKSRFDITFFVLYLLVLLSIVLAHVSSARADDVGTGHKLYTSHGTFDDVRDNLELAITARGMVINNVSHIGDMLARTGEDLGTETRVYANAQALEFCSALLSREMMEIDPHNIVYCPYVISVYALPGETDRVYIAYRLPGWAGSEASQRVLGKVEALLDEIIADSVLP